jgi:hypothetical protein
MSERQTTHTGFAIPVAVDKPGRIVTARFEVGSWEGEEKRIVLEIEPALYGDNWTWLTADDARNVAVGLLQLADRAELEMEPPR